MGTINRSEWLDDAGDNLSGSEVDNAKLQEIYDNIEDEVMSVNKPTITVRSIIDNLIAGVPFDFGGDSNAWVSRLTYATGPGLDPEDTIAPGTRVWKVDPALLAGVLYLEGLLRTDDVTRSTRAALFNMTDAPNVAMVEIASFSLAPVLVRSAAIVWPGGGAEKVFAIKIMTDPAGAANANGWGFRVFRGD
jgi:hypothetical protein